MRRRLPNAWLVAASLAFCCCRTGRSSVPDQPVTQQGRGVYHTVQHGQTLWRIGKAYNVSVDELVAVNQLESPTQIALGQKLWIPRATQVLEVPPAPGEPPAPELNKKPAAAKPPAPVKPPAPAKQAVPAKKPPAVVKAEPVEEDEEDSEPAPSPAAQPPKERAVPAEPGHFIWPVKGLVESPFGARGARQHDGIDIKADRGTPIVAAGPGEVLYSGVQRGYGNIVLVKHDNDLITIYAHNSENRVKVGEKVRQGQTIALVGQTGRATNNHLHFEVRQNRIPKDPLLFLPSE